MCPVVNAVVVNAAVPAVFSTYAAVVAAAVSPADAAASSADAVVA